MKPDYTKDEGLLFYFVQGVLGPLANQVRWLNLQEFQSKKLMADNGINVQKFEVAEKKEDASTIASKLGKLFLFQ